MESNNPQNLTDIIKRAITAVFLGVVCYVVGSFLGAAMCIDDACSVLVNKTATIAGTVVFGLTAVAVFLPVVARYLSEAHVARTADYKRHAETYHDAELRRIERERIEGLNNAEIGRENAKTDLVVEMTKGVLNGSVSPHVFIAMSRAIDGAVLSKSGNMTFAITAPATINHWEYRLMVMGGLESPVKGIDIKGGYLTCSLRALKIAAEIALAGKQPARSEFEVLGISAAEEASECHQFLKDRGLLDPNFTQYRWHPRLDPVKLSKWVKGTERTIAQRGGEAIYRRAAQITTKPAVDHIDI